MRNIELVHVNCHIQVKIDDLNENYFLYENIVCLDESHGGSLMNSTKSSNLMVQENRQQAAKMLIAVVIIFAICYIPVHVFNLFR